MRLIQNKVLGQTLLFWYCGNILSHDHQFDQLFLNDDVVDEDCDGDDEDDDGHDDDDDCE